MSPGEGALPAPVARRKVATVFTPDALPEPLAAVLGQVRAWSGDDARGQLQVAGAESRAAWVAGLQQLADAVAAASLTAVEVFDASGDGQVLHGAASTSAWLRGATRLTGAQAAERVRIARLSRGLLAGPVQQVQNGTLTYEHLRAVERGVRHLPADHQQQGVELLTGGCQVVCVRGRSI